MLEPTYYETDYNHKDLLGSNARIGYCIPVLDFYLVLNGFRWRKSTDGLINQ